jgi:hypothetical protein
VHIPPPSEQQLQEAVELGHEPSAISVRGVMWFFVWFFITAVVVYTVAWLMYRTVLREEEAADVLRSAVPGVLQPPPEPRLQPSIHHQSLPREDLAAMHERERAEFVNRGWFDEKTGKVRIPDDIVNAVIEQTVSKGDNTR